MEERARTRIQRRNYGGEINKKNKLKSAMFRGGTCKKKKTNGDVEKRGTKKRSTPKNRAASVPCEFRVRVNCSKREKSALL